MIKDSLGTRMKDFYESRSQTYLVRRIPVIIRIDGCHFHTFCKRFERPYDKLLNDCLNKTLTYVCSKVQCVKFGQRHSDEMSLLLTDYDTLQTEPYFEYRVQKMCSVVASLATTEFCRQLMIQSIFTNNAGPLSLLEEWPVFDARCFNIPEIEVPNYFWWRILDSKRNSINMVSQSLFSHSELQGVTCDQMQEMLFQKKNINWNDYPQEQKSGYICRKLRTLKPIEKGPNKGEIFERSMWTAIPAPKTKTELDNVFADISLVAKE